MKHILTTILLGCATISGSAQTQGIYQFEDPGFEKYLSGNEPGYGWNSFASATGSVSGFAKNYSPQPSTMTPGANGSNRAVKLKSAKVLGLANANGNLTTGVINMGNSNALDPSNHNFTDIEDPKHSLRFAGRPDAVTFYAKFKAGKGNIDTCGNANFILHDNCKYRDPEIQTQEGNRIGKASQKIIESTDWKIYTADFTYDKAQTDVQYLLASVTTNPVPGQSSGDELYFDEVYFVYYSTLQSLTYAGTNLTLAKNATTYDLSTEIYDESKLSYEVKGAGATATQNYDATTGLLTITVNGNDISVNPNNKTEYTIQFAKPHANGTGKLLSLEVNGTAVSNFKADSLYYTIIDEYVENGINYTTEDGKDANVVINYAPNSRIATITVTAKYGGAENIYKIKFAKETTDYVGKMLISMQNDLIAAGNDPIGVTEPEFGQIDLQLLNFKLDGSPVGDIFITGVPYSPNEKGDVSLYKQQKTTIFGAMGEGLGPISIELNAKIIDKKFEGTINILWMGVIPIEVKIYPFDTPYMDIPATSTSTKITNIMANMTNKNLLVYLTEEVSNKNNIVVNGQCANLSLTDGYEFHAPKEFTATNVSYNRQFTAGNISSFVLPFSMNASDVNGKVYQLSGIEGDVLKFETVNGTVAANQPYIVDVNSTNLFNGVANANVAATTTLNNVKGTATHVGSYTTQKIVSDNLTSYYGYSKGNFVKANTGTLNPFRTAIKVTGAKAQTLALSLDGNITGIGCIENGSLNLNANVDVYDINGRLIRKNVKAATSLQGLPNGIYVVDGKKIIKK